MPFTDLGEIGSTSSSLLAITQFTDLWKVNCGRHIDNLELLDQTNGRLISKYVIDPTKSQRSAVELVGTVADYSSVDRSEEEKSDNTLQDSGCVEKWLQFSATKRGFGRWCCGCGTTV